MCKGAILKLAEAGKDISRTELHGGPNDGLLWSHTRSKMIKTDDRVVWQTFFDGKKKTMQHSSWLNRIFSTMPVGMWKSALDDHQVAWLIVKVLFRINRTILNEMMEEERPELIMWTRQRDNIDWPTPSISSRFCAHLTHLTHHIPNLRQELS